MNAIVDGKSIVQAIHSTALVDDKKLRRDISINKQMLNKKEVASVSWCPGMEQLADCMTKEEYVREKGGAAASLISFKGKEIGGRWSYFIMKGT